MKYIILPSLRFFAAVVVVVSYYITCGVMYIWFCFWNFSLGPFEMPYFADDGNRHHVYKTPIDWYLKRKTKTWSTKK
jgi:hypothetical protein